ncbi:hypothetical protein HDU97_002252 [Phlyctochytrium planicorne]|nr:hypothetical protein HDU97_002252 [Phlyctochytrium planicorne]
MSFGRLSKLAEELQQSVLEATDDWRACLQIEAINAALPRRFEDPERAIKSIDIPSIFPITCKVFKCTPSPDLAKLTLLQAAFMVQIQDFPDLFPIPIGDTIDLPAWRHKRGIQLKVELTRAIIENNLDSVKILTQTHHLVHPRIFETTEIVDKACLDGRLESLKYLHQHKLGSFRNSLFRASSKGHLEVVKWLATTRNDGGHARAIELAVRYGHHDLFHWLHSRKRVSSNDEVKPMQWAALNGDLGLIKWMYGREPYLVISNAAKGGHLEILEWISRIALKGIYEGARRQFFARLDNPMYAAAENGDLETIKWLHANWPNKFLEVDSPMDAAAANGHLKVLQWLHLNRSEGCTQKAMDFAASKGHLDVVVWLHENRTEGCSFAMNGAARNGHLDVVKWLHHNRLEGCTNIAMDNAATNGHLNVVQWLLDNRTEGCSTNALDGASANNHREIVQFLIKHASARCTKAAVIAACRNGNLEILQALHALPTSPFTTAAMDEACSDGNLNIVQWLHANRTEGCTTTAMDAAANYGHIHVVKWLHQNRTEGCTARALTFAASEGYLDVVEFLCENREEVCMTDTLKALEMLDDAFDEIVDWFKERTKIA